jgi:hypothetical protein
MSKRTCKIERPFHGTCMNLELGMRCSQIPSSLCMIYAERAIENGFASKELKNKIELAKKYNIYSDTCGSIVFDVPCNNCEQELVDMSSVKPIKEKYYCYECTDKIKGKNVK